MTPITHRPMQPLSGHLLREDGPTRPLIRTRSALAVFGSTLVRTLVFVLVMAGVLLAINVSFTLVGPFPPESDQYRQAIYYVGGSSMIVAPIIAYLLVVAVFERRGFPIELGPRRLWHLAVGLVIGAVLFALCYGLITLLGGYQFITVATVDWDSVWLSVFMTGLVAGVSEEIIFRGILYRYLEEFWGSWVAIIGSAFIFGLGHLSNLDASLWGGIAIALEFGLLVAALYAWTRSLWLVIGIHAAWNVMQGPILGVPVSGTGDRPGVFDTVFLGPDWLTGGIFGTEASVITVVLLTGVAVALMVVLVKKKMLVPPSWVRLRKALETPATPHSKE